MPKPDKDLPPIFGLIPAAGYAARLPGLTCSKEILPIGQHTVGDTTRPKAVCLYLLEKMKVAGITRIYMVLREGKEDIPASLGKHALPGIELEYPMTNIDYGAPFTLDAAFNHVEHALVALGFPDMLFRPDDIFIRLLDKQRQSAADIVLGLFPTDQPERVDMVEFDNEGRVVSLQIKPKMTDLHFTWGVVVWTPAFTQFMHNYLGNIKVDLENGQFERELHVGDVIQAAIETGMCVEGIQVSDEPYLDIGTPDNLDKAKKLIWIRQRKE